MLRKASSIHFSCGTFCPFMLLTLKKDVQISMLAAGWHFHRADFCQSS
uniref:Uncharacterized protein n=1 Tax=Anguilla anguilla TaxID=7936 RepID=A0A0E9WPL0_ANGAN